VTDRADSAFSCVCVCVCVLPRFDRPGTVCCVTWWFELLAWSAVPAVCVASSTYPPAVVLLGHVNEWLQIEALELQPFIDIAKKNDSRADLSGRLGHGWQAPSHACPLLMGAGNTWVAMQKTAVSETYSTDSFGTYVSASWL